jgi:hypothetical protein
MTADQTLEPRAAPVFRRSGGMDATFRPTDAGAGPGDVQSDLPPCDPWVGAPTTCPGIGRGPAARAERVGWGGQSGSALLVQECLYLVDGSFEVVVDDGGVKVVGEAFLRVGFFEAASQDLRGCVGIAAAEPFPLCVA